MFFSNLLVFIGDTLKFKEADLCYSG